MNPRRALVVCAACAVLGAAPPNAPPRATLDAAARTVRTLRARLGKAFTPLAHQAKAVLVAPDGDAGDAVLLIHWRGHWSEPAFFDAAALHTPKASVLLIMSDRGLDALLHQRGLPLDGPDPLTLARLPGRVGAELLLWPKAAALDPAGFTADDAANIQWYGRPRNAPEIVGGTPPDPRSATLRGLLGAG